MDFNATAQTFGFAAACLVALGAGVGVAMIWFARSILKPGFDRHIAFVDKVQEAVTKHAESQVLQTLAMQQQTAAMQTLAANEQTTTHSLKQIAEARNEITNKLQELLRVTVEGNTQIRQHHEITESAIKQREDRRKEREGGQV